MNLQREFKKETGMNAYINRVGRNTQYHQSYTKWLETKTHEVKNLTLQRVSVSFADFLLTHKQSDEVQKATAHKLFKDFIEAYEL